MEDLFNALALADVRRDVFRNIVSLRSPQQLFDDLTDDPAGWALAQQVEGEVSPPVWQSATPVIDRPFEDAAWANAIRWPFGHWRASRWSDGRFGVWYGCDSVETSVHESAFHWYRGLLRDAGFEREAVVAERGVYAVACAAALLDLRQVTARHPGLLHPADYTLCQAVGARIHREGHPGLLVQSVRRPAGECVAIFNPRVLSNPRLHGELTYRLERGRIVVEQQPGVAWFAIDVAVFA